jgi:hypothetical protein
VLLLGVPAALFDRITDAAGAGITGPFLSEDFSRRAGDFAARQRADGALALIRVICDQDLFQQVLANFAAEFGLVDLEALQLLPGLIEYGDFNHDACSFFTRAVTA